MNVPVIYSIGHSRLAEVRDEGLLRETATFLYLKYLHKNSCIFNYSVYRLSKKSGLSRSCIRRGMSIFREKGWVREHGGNLIFLSLKNFSQNASFEIKFPKRGKAQIKEILSQLQYSLLKTKINQIEYVIQKRKDRHNPRKTQDLKSSIRFLRKSKVYKGEISQRTTVSIKGLSKVWGLSTSQSSRVINELARRGWVTVKRSLTVLFSGISPKHFQKIRNEVMGYCYFWKGKVIQVKASTITLSYLPCSRKVFS